MAKISFNSIPAPNGEGNNFNSVPFFSLKKDGDEAIVRIMHDSVDDFEVLTTHQVKVGNGFRSVNCLRDPHTPVDACPLCQNNVKMQNRLYIHMIQYVRNEQGKIEPKPVVWERSAFTYGSQLSNLINEYGPLSECIFKIRRNGAPGNMQTTYDIMFGNPNMYNEAMYPKVPNAFDNYSACGTIVLDKTAEEINEFLATGSFPTKSGAPAPATPNNAMRNAVEAIVDDDDPPQTYIPGVPYAGSTPPQRPTRYY